MDISKWFSGNKSCILSFVACVGVVVTAALSFKGAIKAKETMDKWTEEKHDELTTFEKVQASAKHMVPAAVAGAVTIGCIAKSHKIDKEHIAVLAASAAGMAKKYDDYRRANVEVNGKEADDKVVKELEIREVSGCPIGSLVVQDAKQSYISAESLCQHVSLNSKLSQEKFLFKDEITNVRFTASLAQVLDAICALNRNFQLGHPEVDVHMWADFLGIKIDKHDNRGWVFCDDLTWLDFNISDPIEVQDGVKEIIISPVTTPIPEYWNYDPFTDKYYNDEDYNIYEEIIQDSQVPF